MSNGEEVNVNGGDIWGAIDLASWRETPHKKADVASEQVVKDGTAVFYIRPDGNDHRILEVKVPSLAFFFDPETKERNIVVVIQGERVGDEELIGFRYLNGGNGICTVSELEFVDESDLLPK
jgi:hypothetical protein